MKHRDFLKILTVAPLAPSSLDILKPEAIPLFPPKTAVKEPESIHVENLQPFIFDDCCITFGNSSDFNIKWDSDYENQT